MISIPEADRLRTVNKLTFSNIEKNGEPIINGEMIRIPSNDELKRQAFSEIYSRGFDLIQTVPESEADAIVRIYSKLHYLYQDSMYNFFGYKVHTRKTKGFKSLSIDGKKEKYDRNNCTLKIWLDGDESITVSCDYIDIPIKIARMM
ncbi:MAG: hypothetical protein IKF52_02755 [Clostridia bacterium]|nr:hypothetical protein [Clostridia bacterium]